MPADADGGVRPRDLKAGMLKRCVRLAPAGDRAARVSDHMTRGADSYSGFRREDGHLVDRDLVFSDRDTFRNRNVTRQPFDVKVTDFACRRAHQEIPSRQRDHFRTDLAVLEAELLRAGDMTRANQ